MMNQPDSPQKPPNANKKQEGFPKPAAAPRPAQDSGFKPSGRGCYKAESTSAVVSFCVIDTFGHGNSAGGVFKGTLYCKSDDARLCEQLYGLRRAETKKVVVKFNEVGSELRRGNFPASSTQDELMALLASRGHINAIRLYKTFGEEGTRSKIGQKEFWNPGMVIELVDGGELLEFAQRNARQGWALNIERFAAQINCMFEQLENFSDFMISKNFFHKDMHTQNILLSRTAFEDMRGVTCAFIKVIDFGVIAKLPTVEDKLFGIALYADSIDFNIARLLSLFRIDTQRRELKLRLAPNERTRRLFLKYLHAAGPHVVKNVFPHLKKIGIEYAANPYSYTNFLHQTIAYFLS